MNRLEKNILHHAKAKREARQLEVKSEIENIDIQIEKLQNKIRTLEKVKTTLKESHDLS